MSRTSLKSQFSVFVHWKLQVSTSHLCGVHTGPWLVSRLVVMSQNPAHVYTLNRDLRWQRNFQHSCENSLQVTRTSFCTVKLNHPREVTTNKTHCWVEGDKRILHETEQWLLYPFVLEDIIYRIKLIRDVFSSVGEETDTQRYSINATLLAWWLMQKDKTIALLITACEVLIGFKWTLLNAHPSTNLHPKNITEFQRPSPILRRSSLCCLGFCLRLPGAQSRESSSKMPIIHR